MRNASIELKAIIYRMPEILLAAKIPFRGLYGCMSKQELNLLQLPAIAVTQFRTRAPQVVRSNMFQSRTLTAGSDHVPHYILRDSLAPHPARPGHGPKDSSLSYSRRRHPLIESRFDPFGNRNGADVAALANQVHDGPVPLAHLDLMHLQPN